MPTQYSISCPANKADSSFFRRPSYKEAHALLNKASPPLPKASPPNTWLPFYVVYLTVTTLFRLIWHSKPNSVRCQINRNSVVKIQSKKVQRFLRLQSFQTGQQMRSEKYFPIDLAQQTEFR